MPQDNTVGIMGNNFKMSGFIAVDGSAYHFVNFYWFFSFNFSFCFIHRCTNECTWDHLWPTNIADSSLFFTKIWNVAHLVEHIAFDSIARACLPLGTRSLAGLPSFFYPWSTFLNLRPLRFFWDGTQTWIFTSAISPTSSHIYMTGGGRGGSRRKNTLIMVFNQSFYCCILSPLIAQFHHYIITESSTSPANWDGHYTIIKVIQCSFSFSREKHYVGNGRRNTLHEIVCLEFRGCKLAVGDDKRYTTITTTTKWIIIIIIILIDYYDNKMPRNAERGRAQLPIRWIVFIASCVGAATKEACGCTTSWPRMKNNQPGQACRRRCATAKREEHPPEFTRGHGETVQLWPGVAASRQPRRIEEFYEQLKKEYAVRYLEAMGANADYNRHGGETFTNARKW